jgi:hypothetical protein
MEQQKIEIVKKLAHDYNQFEKSLLQPAIASVIAGNSLETAMKLGKSHCNMLSWFFGLYAEGIIKTNYRDFFYKSLRVGACSESGYTLIYKNKIAPVFGFKQNVDYIRDWNYVLDPSKLDKDKFYQFKKIKTDHYMISWIEDVPVDKFPTIKKITQDDKDTKPVLMIADTHDRGYGVPLLTHGRVDMEHFGFLLRLGE